MLCVPVSMWLPAVGVSICRKRKKMMAMGTAMTGNVEEGTIRWVPLHWVVNEKCIIVGEELAYIYLP